MSVKAYALRRFGLPFTMLMYVGCAATPNIASIDLEKLGPEEGIFVTRVITNIAPHKSDQKPTKEPRIRYRLTYGQPRFVAGFIPLPDFGEETIDIDSRGGPELVVRRLNGGEYKFTQYQRGNGEGWMHVSFDVSPGEITYIGDLIFSFNTTKILGIRAYTVHHVESQMHAGEVQTLVEERYLQNIEAMRSDPMFVFERGITCCFSTTAP